VDEAYSEFVNVPGFEKAGRSAREGGTQRRGVAAFSKITAAGMPGGLDRQNGDLMTSSRRGGAIAISSLRAHARRRAMLTSARREGRAVTRDAARGAHDAMKSRQVRGIPRRGISQCSPHPRAPLAPVIAAARKHPCRLAEFQAVNRTTCVVDRGTARR